jgi:hypothetical protein
MAGRSDGRGEYSDGFPLKQEGGKIPPNVSLRARLMREEIESVRPGAFDGHVFTKEQLEAELEKVAASGSLGLRLCGVCGYAGPWEEETHPCTGSPKRLGNE